MDRLLPSDTLVLEKHGMALLSRLWLWLLHGPGRAEPCRHRPCLSIILLNECTHRPSGAKLRLDSTLLSMTEQNIKRGNMSVIINAESKNGTCPAPTHPCAPCERWLPIRGAHVQFLARQMCGCTMCSTTKRSTQRRSLRVCSRTSQTRCGEGGDEVQDRGRLCGTGTCGTAQPLGTPTILFSPELPRAG